MKTLLALALLCLSCGVLLGEREIPTVAKRRADLDRITIPVVSFDDRTIQEAVDFAWARAVELDVRTIEARQKGVLIMIRFSSGIVYPEFTKKQQERSEVQSSTKINFHARDISLTTLLKEIAKQSGCDLYTTSVGVVFCPPGSSPFPNARATKGETWEAVYTVPQKKSPDKAGNPQ